MNVGNYPAVGEAALGDLLLTTRALDGKTINTTVETLSNAISEATRQSLLALDGLIDPITTDRVLGINSLGLGTWTIEQMRIGLQTAITFLDEGVPLGDADIDSIDFVGSGVSVTRVGNTLTVSVTGGGGGATEFIQLTDVPGSYTGAELKAVRVNAAGTALEFYTPPGGGMTPGNLVINVPTDAANFAAALAIAKASSYSGTVRINFEAGYTIAEPLWFDGVNMPNLDVSFAGAPQAVDATTFPPLLLGAYRVVLGLNESRIGRVYGSLSVTAGNGPDLLAFSQNDSTFTSGRNDYIGSSTSLTISGTTGGGVVIGDSALRSEAPFVVPTLGSGDIEIAGGQLQGWQLSFGGNSLLLGAIPALGLSRPVAGNFSSVSLTGTECYFVVAGGSVDLGHLSIASGCDFRFDAAYAADVIGRIPAAITVDSPVGATGVFGAATGAQVKIAADNITWKPALAGQSLAYSVNLSDVTIDCANLTIDTTTATPTNLVQGYQSATVSLHVDGTVTGSYGAVANVPPNAVTPGTGADGGVLVRTNLAPENEWAALTLENAWVDIGAPAQVAQFRKVGDMVGVRFAVVDGTAPQMFTLPVGFRPPASIGISVNVHDNTNAPDFGHLRIAADGTATLEHPGSLSGHSVWGTFEFSVSP